MIQLRGSRPLAALMRRMGVKSIALTAEELAAFPTDLPVLFVVMDDASGVELRLPEKEPDENA